MARLGRGFPVQVRNVAAVAPPGPITGTAAVTLDDFTSAASGTFTPLAITGTVAVTLGDFTASASGSFTPAGSGSAAITLDAFTASASGTVVAITGTSAVTLANFTSSATGWVTITGTAAVTLDPFTSTSRSSPPYPATISGRKLLDQHGNPIQMRCLSSWGLIQINDNTTITARLEEAAARGFNCVAVVMDGSNDYGTGWEKWQNAVTNETFYTGTPLQSTLGTAWSTHVSHLMSETARLGMFVVASCYLGFGSVGANSALTAAEAAGKADDAGAAWATFLASWDHWMLHIGADRNDASTAGIEHFCQGVKSVRSGILIVAEPDQNLDTLELWSPGSFTYFTPLEGVYDYGESMTDIIDTTFGNGLSTRPVWDTEPGYIGANHYTTDTSGAPNATERKFLRYRHYATVIRGGIGLNNGHEDWWRFGAQGLFTAGDTPSTAMANTSIVEFQYGWTIWTLCNTTGWAATSSFIDNGSTGLGSTTSKAAQGTDGNTAIAYFPDNRTVTVDTTILTGTSPVKLRWFDPTAGTFATISSSEAQQTGRSVTLPAARGDGTRDFVLVVTLSDDRTGSAAVTLDAFTSSATGQVGQNGTASSTLGDFTSSASGTFTPAPVTGTAAVTLDAFTSSATGTVVAFVGTSAVTLGDFTASALGSFTPAGSGFAAVTLDPFTSSASGTIGENGTAATTLGDFTASASGTFVPGGTAAVVLGDFTSSATGAVIGAITGTASSTLGPFTATGTGTYTPQAITGTAAIVLDPFISSTGVTIGTSRAVISGASSRSTISGPSATATITEEDS